MRIRSKSFIKDAQGRAYPQQKEVQIGTESNSLLADAEKEVSAEDIACCKQALSRPDRVGKYAVWICTVIFAFAGWLLVNWIMADDPVNHPWYSYIPILGERLWQAPFYTKIPIVGKTMHDVGVWKFAGLCAGAVIGYLIGKSVSFGIRNGAQQDIRNRQKI